MFLTAPELVLEALQGFQRAAPCSQGRHSLLRLQPHGNRPSGVTAAVRERPPAQLHTVVQAPVQALALALEQVLAREPQRQTRMTRAAGSLLEEPSWPAPCKQPPRCRRPIRSLRPRP